MNADRPPDARTRPSPPSGPSDLMPLYVRALAHHAASVKNEWLVPNSIPIVYFGNLARYRSSPFKIITVGLNPSDAEFIEPRFGNASSASTPAELERALCGYFMDNPYSGWFRAFETLLQPLGASFYDDHYPGSAPSWWSPQPNTALHTDLCSPLATRPTWSRLDDRTKDALRAFGVPFWRDLIRVLAPNLIIISVAWPYLRDIGDLSWRRFPAFTGASRNQEMMIARSSVSHVVWGRAGRRPLFYIEDDRRAATAAEILTQIRRESITSMSTSIIQPSS